jgi:hypothetical protein
MLLTIAAMQAEDWAAVRVIYWDRGHLPQCRCVAKFDEQVVGKVVGV